MSDCCESWSSTRRQKSREVTKTNEKTVGPSCETSCCNKCCLPKLATLPSGSVEFSVTYRGTSHGESSYVDGYVTFGGILTPTGTTTVYNCWCSQNNILIDVGVNYAANVVSTLDKNLGSILQSSSLDIPFNNIPMINYIMNRVSYYENTLGYTFGDIQTAIWQLIGAANPSDPTAPYVQAHVTAIIADATVNGVNFYPTSPAEFIAVYVLPIGPWVGFSVPPLTNQPMLLQVPLYIFGLTCDICRVRQLQRA